MKNLKVLAILPISIGGRLTTSSIIDGLVQNGITPCIHDELLMSDNDFTHKENFDIIIGYDFSPLKFKIQHKLSAKCICYFSDEIQSKTSGPDWQIYYNDLSRNDVFTYFWDREMIKKYPFKNIHYLPHFVNFEVYQPNHTNHFDVMFAGRLDTDFRLSFFTDLIQKLPDLKFAWFAIKRHYKDALTRTKNPDIIRSAYQGFIDNEKDMAKAINGSKILFNMNAQGKSSLNYRTFQAIACKRLIISDKRDELDLFKGGLPYWENLEDLVAKIRYYIDSPTTYDATVNQCYEIGRKNHHSKENVEFILKKALITNA